MADPKEDDFLDDIEDAASEEAENHQLKSTPPKPKWTPPVRDSGQHFSTRQ